MLLLLSVVVSEKNNTKQMVAVEKRMVRIKIAGFDCCIILCIWGYSFLYQLDSLQRYQYSPMTEILDPLLYFFLMVVCVCKGSVYGQAILSISSQCTSIEDKYACHGNVLLGYTTTPKLFTPGARE